MSCQCQTNRIHRSSLTVVKDLGEHRWAHIDIRRCPLCGAQFLAFFHESEAFRKSGVWYVLPLTAEQLVEVTLENSRETFENAEWYWSGGSFWDGDVHQRSGQLRTAP